MTCNLHFNPLYGLLFSWIELNCSQIHHQSKGAAEIVEGSIFLSGMVAVTASPPS
jgi:hypothetical protein